MRLIDYLSVPYRLEAETVELANGAWVRRVGYPELPGCVVESAVVEDALSQLERKRIEIIIAYGRRRPVTAGAAPAAARLRSGVGCEKGRSFAEARCSD